MLGHKIDEWTIGGHSESRTQRVTEYVPPGQKIESWTELLTVPDDQETRKPPAIDALAASAYKDLTKRCPGKVTWNVIAREAASRRGGESLLFEWSVKDCPRTRISMKLRERCTGSTTSFGSPMLRRLSRWHRRSGRSG